MPAPAASLRRLETTRRIIFLLLAVTVIVPFFLNVQMKFKPDVLARRLYERIEALPRGSHVLLAFDFDPASEAELYPMSMALLRHCFRKGVIPIVMTNWSSGLRLAGRLVETAVADSERRLGQQIVSGRDYAFLGFKPGMAMLIVNMGENIRSAFARDYYGQATTGMEALKGGQRLKEIDLVVDIAAGATVEVWIAYGADKFGFPLGAGTTAVMAPDMYPFIQSGQLAGLLGGLRGAADYEMLLRHPDVGASGMVGQSAAHVLLIVLVLGANVWSLARHVRQKRKG